MDIPLPPRPWYVKYRMYILGGAVLVALVVYALILQLGPRTLKVEIADEQIAVVTEGEFLEYIDVNGVVAPATSMRVNAIESGTVERICCHNGDVLRRGDTILILSNPKVLEEMATERQNYDLQQMQHRQQLIEMQQKSITLRSQALQANFQDSVLNVIGRQLIQQQMAMEAQKLGNSDRRRDGLTILAPADGQIGNLNAVIGGQVAAGEQVGEIGVLTDYKVTARLNEYFIDRIHTGLPASAMLKGQRHAFEVSRITPQVQDHSFAVELKPESGDGSFRPGQTLLLQIELGKPERRLMIPRGSFYAQTGGQWVMLVDETGHRARRVPIRLGRQNTEHYEVIGGLRPGDRILVSGYEAFGDADVVKW